MSHSVCAKLLLYPLRYSFFFLDTDTLLVGVISEGVVIGILAPSVLVLLIAVIILACKPKKSREGKNTNMGAGNVLDGYDDSDDKV